MIDLPSNFGKYVTLYTVLKDCCFQLKMVSIHFGF